MEIVDLTSSIMCTPVKRKELTQQKHTDKTQLERKTKTKGGLEVTVGSVTTVLNSKEYYAVSGWVMGDGSKGRPGGTVTLQGLEGRYGVITALQHVDDEEVVN